MLWSVLYWSFIEQQTIKLSLIDLVWENSIDASVTFGTHTYNTVCVCVCVCVCDIHNKPKCSIM